MDSLTQVVLDSSVAALAVPEKHRRVALVAGGRTAAVAVYFFRYDIAGLDVEGRWIAASEIVRIPAPGDRMVGLAWPGLGLASPARPR